MADLSRREEEAAGRVASAIASVLGSALDQEPDGVDVEVVSCRPRLAVLVHGTRTPLERVLLGAGEPALVQQGRDALRQALERPLVDAVEDALGADIDELSGSHDPPTGTETLLFRVSRSSGELSLH